MSQGAAGQNTLPVSSGISVIDYTRSFQLRVVRHAAPAAQKERVGNRAVAYSLEALLHHSRRSDEQRGT